MCSTEIDINVDGDLTRPFCLFITLKVALNISFNEKSIREESMFIRII